MTTIRHGSVLPLETADFLTESESMNRNIPATCYPRWPFGYLFPELQSDPQKLLEPSEDTVKNLRWLGQDGMDDPPQAEAPGVPVPAVYTFFGQFVDHDITFERASSTLSLSNPVPIDPAQLPYKIVNSRSPNLDLDNVYGPDLLGQMSPRDPQNPDKMLIGKVVGLRQSQGLPPGKSEYNDLPRRDDGSAQIGDPRDDENLIIAQLHVAFLRAHNKLIDRGLRFDEARKLLRQHYQWIVLDDFLERICDPNIVKTVRYHGPRFFNPPPRAFFVPLEFSVAAYRFGHSKVRPAYNDFNCLQPGGALDQIFSRAGQPLVDDWVIDWTAFLDTEKPIHFPRPIDTTLAHSLLDLQPLQLGPGDPEPNLAIRNLLRGYILRLPTGQAVARAMAPQGILTLTADQIFSVAVSPAQQEILKRTGFLDRTPLWFYILAEAAFYSRGYHLGPVGSTIVAEVLIGVLRNSTDSILSDSQWRPTLGSMPGKFDIEDLLKLAGVF